MNKDTIKTWLKANVWDGKGHEEDHGSFSPDGMLDLVWDCFEDIGPAWAIMYRLRDGRIGECGFTGSELRVLYELQIEGKVKCALFDRNPSGELISLHPYYYLTGDTRDERGFHSEVEV